MSHLIICVEAWPNVQHDYIEHLRSKVYKHPKYGLWNLVVREMKFYDIHIPEESLKEVANDLAIDSDEEIGFFNNIMKNPIFGRILRKFIPKLKPVEIDYKKLDERRKNGEFGFCGNNGWKWARIRAMAEYKDDFHPNPKTGELEEGL